MIGFAALNDPLREDIQDSLDSIKKAGIMVKNYLFIKEKKIFLKVRMVTGDSIITACTLAKKCGILNK